jgi:hypothetical protein
LVGASLSGGMTHIPEELAKQFSSLLLSAMVEDTNGRAMQM